VAVGEGKIPIASIFHALQTINYPGYVNLEYEINAKDPLPGMQISFAHMRGVLAGLAESSVAATPSRSSSKSRG
jgi:sugar phosphate isomerase/epimerase